MNEQVLVFPTSELEAMGVMRGYHEQGVYCLNYLENSGKLHLMDRSEAETNEEFLQLIPYCVFTHNGKYFVYERTKKGGENRLYNKISLGIGGHLSERDYKAGLLRELAEEVYSGVKYVHLGIVGTVYDDQDAVGRVHFGIVHLFSLEAEDMRLNEDCLEAVGFLSLEELRSNYSRFENWSKMIVDFLWENK